MQRLGENPYIVLGNEWVKHPKSFQSFSNVALWLKFPNLWNLADGENETYSRPQKHI